MNLVNKSLTKGRKFYRGQTLVCFVLDHHVHLVLHAHPLKCQRYALELTAVDCYQIDWN